MIAVVTNNRSPSLRDAIAGGGGSNNDGHGNGVLKAHVPSGRSCPAWCTGTHGDSVFVFGGYDGLHRMNDFHQFFFRSRTWLAIRSSGQVGTCAAYNYMHKYRRVCF